MVKCAEEPSFRSWWERQNVFARLLVAWATNATNASMCVLLVQFLLRHGRSNVPFLWSVIRARSENEASSQIPQQTWHVPAILFTKKLLTSKARQIGYVIRSDTINPTLLVLQARNVEDWTVYVWMSHLYRSPSKWSAQVLPFHFCAPLTWIKSAHLV